MCCVCGREHLFPYLCLHVFKYSNSICYAMLCISWKSNCCMVPVVFCSNARWKRKLNQLKGYTCFVYRWRPSVWIRHMMHQGNITQSMRICTVCKINKMKIFPFLFKNFRIVVITKMLKNGFQLAWYSCTQNVIVLCIQLLWHLCFYWHICNILTEIKNNLVQSFFFNFKANFGLVHFFFWQIFFFLITYLICCWW